MLIITDTLTLQESEIEITAVRSRGPGGQNVNKVSTAIHLRFDVKASSLPDFIKLRLMRLGDHRITKEGVIIIKARNHRTQEKNREEALTRLQHLIQNAAVTRKKRRPTRPSPASEKNRLEGKNRRGRLKRLRGKVNFRDGDG